ncbi:hypothetical protein CHK22_08820 [Salmonella enterica]|uniref:Prophage protein n=3 Tax=Salmonella enterica I TaxID=59201 RepID=A0A733Y4T5_SALET|nr:hypothetical protein [Salmonella enterica]EAA0939511.1 hypothetical protein [Salmonella enterica subsp. enterica serovar Braenderup]EAA5837288.1 hypothetical protein [Salmonella enterica subsp. enterica serovar Tennessee]EBK1726169.1 hypothetical protein [Salmonella enterica subsp. enterica serovar Virchow]EBW2308915.1 hypothetical protein [Salmonella enterica subsp. enterica serovar Kingston]EBW2318712.1 hypothetical protein [Salmonella enterica subsp. enterica serovar Brancaster]EBW77911
MITKNFQLNALANQYAAALYNHITTSSSGDFFMLDLNGASMRVEIAGGVKGVRELIDGYALEALKQSYQQWESIGIELLSKCVNHTGLTSHGHEIWKSMVNDMGATVAGNFGGKNA